MSFETPFGHGPADAGSLDDRLDAEHKRTERIRDERMRAIETAEAELDDRPEDIKYSRLLSESERATAERDAFVERVTSWLETGIPAPAYEARLRGAVESDERIRELLVFAARFQIAAGFITTRQARERLQSVGVSL